jgi:hypothetical protein
VPPQFQNHRGEDEQTISFPIVLSTSAVRRGGCPDGAYLQIAAPEVVVPSISQLLAGLVREARRQSRPAAARGSDSADRDRRERNGFRMEVDRGPWEM